MDKKFKKTSLFRRTFLVDERFQLRFLGFCGLTALVACGLFYGTSCYFFSKYTNYAIDAGLRASDPFYKVLSNMEDLLTWFFAIVSGSTIVFTTIAGLIFSNRVAGPLVRLRGHCERVARGETLDGIQFRHDDYFEDLAKAYNKQMESIRAKLVPTVAAPEGEPPTSAKPETEKAAA